MNAIILLCIIMRPDEAAYRMMGYGYDYKTSIRFCHSTTIFSVMLIICYTTIIMNYIGTIGAYG